LLKSLDSVERLVLVPALALALAAALVEVLAVELLGPIVRGRQMLRYDQTWGMKSMKSQEQEDGLELLQ
jgi:hypothetical protein